MSDLIKKLNHGDYQYGDVVRLSGLPKTKGKRYKYVGAVFIDEAADEPEYFELIEIGRGTMRSIRPEYVVKDVKASKAAQDRIKNAKV